MAITHRKLNSDLVGTCQQLILGGVTAIMIREKDLSFDELCNLAKPVVALCRDHGVLSIISRFPSVALELAADGVHLGHDGPPVAEVKQNLPATMCLGVSCHNQQELLHAKEAGADYATLSPVFAPTSKPAFQTPLGLSQFTTLVAKIDMPVVALGGISVHNQENCLNAGAVGVAAIGNLYCAADPQAAARSFLAS
jgi:thiamine-phosphate pyrophosphorylase